MGRWTTNNNDDETNIFSWKDTYLAAWDIYEGGQD